MVLGCPSRTEHARVLKFHVWIPHGKIADTLFFLVQVISLSGVMPLWNFEKKSEWNLMHVISYKPCMLGFWNFIMDSSWKNSWLTFFLVRVISLSGIMPLWKNQNEIWCMPYLMNCACLGFEISYVDSSWKNSWHVYFFSWQSYLPFWNLELCPFEKFRMESCQQDISKSIWARGLKLGQLIEDDHWSVDYMIKLKKNHLIFPDLWPFENLGILKLSAKCLEKYVS